MMRKCKKCGVTILDDKAKLCPNCGAKIKKKSILGWIIAWILLLIVVSALPSFINTSGDSGSTNTGSNKTTTSLQENGYSEEITFQDCQWGTNVIELSRKYNADYFENVTPAWSNADNLMPYSNYSLGYRVFSYGDQSIAGYKVANFSMYCMYGYKNDRLSTAAEDSQLYLVTMNFEVADIEGTYQDLFTKLTELYGEAKVSKSTGSSYSLGDGFYKSSITKAEWNGLNNTGIILSMSLPDEKAPDSADAFNKYVVLSYGKTDSDKTLSQLYRNYQQFVAEEERNNRDATNNDGL